MENLIKRYESQSAPIDIISNYTFKQPHLIEGMILESLDNVLKSEYDNIFSLIEFGNYIPPDTSVKQFYEHKLLDLYVACIDHLINFRIDAAIFSFMDYFFHNENIFSFSTEKNLSFLNKSYPILLIDSEPATFISNAALKFLYIIEEDRATTPDKDNSSLYFAGKGRQMFEKFKSQYPELFDSIWI